jgi:DNA repair protein SbcC/Rad50
MKITLKNFRCHENAVFDFGNTGIVLLSAVSGAGKSSILMAIYFALYGTGTKLVTFGKSSCSVVLEFDDMSIQSITRSKRPNRVVLVDSDGVEYEDDSAQSIIDKQFGSTFETIGYISQNARDSFVLMSPIEKLAFLEKFAFSDVNLVEIKQRCKDITKERHDQLTRATSQLELAKEMFDTISRPSDVIPIPEILNGVKNIDKAISNETIRYKNTQTLIKRAQKTISRTTTEISTIELVTSKIESKMETLSSSLQSRDKLKREYDNMCLQLSLDDIVLYQQELDSLISNRELFSLEKRYADESAQLTEMKNNETQDIEEKIKHIKSELWVEYSKDDIDQNITENRTVIGDLEKLDKLNINLGLIKHITPEDVDMLVNKLTILRTDLDTQNKLHDKLSLQAEILTCPKCHAGLRLQDNSGMQLIECQDVEIQHESVDILSVTNDISKIKKSILETERELQTKRGLLDKHTDISDQISSITSLYDELPKIADVKYELSEMLEYKTKHLELEGSLNRLSVSKPTQSLLSFERNVKKQELVLIDMRKKASHVVSSSKSEQELRDLISTHAHISTRMLTLKSEIVDTSTLIDTYEKDILDITTEHTKTHGALDNITTLKTVLHDAKKEMRKLEKQEVVHANNVSEIKTYLEYKEKADAYTAYHAKFHTLSKTETECRKLYGAITLLKEKIVEAESIAMINIIESINTHTQPYFDCFFPDNPISVKLVPFKEGKKGIANKPQINLQIEYKGMEADINMLSGGELSRVILAFALALGEMFNVPMMMLDECTASLDQELTTVVMDGIRDNFNGKIVLMVCHQSIEAMFDRVLRLD